MRVQVIFANGDIGQVYEQALEHLIQQDEIVAFRRSTGWTQVHQVREAQESYKGPGKRWNDVPDSGSGRRTNSL